MKLFFSILFFFIVVIPTINVQAQNPANSVEEKIFVTAEEMPQFPGGQDSMMAFIGRNIRYPQEALANGITGVCYVNFVVDASGKVKSPQILKSAAPILDKEAIRIIMAMPTWKPGKQNGQPVAVKFTLPVRFQFQNSEPQFPGGQQALIEYLIANMDYPVAAEDKEGFVNVSFMVLRNGTINEFKIINSPHPALSAEVQRVITAVPKWEPGTAKGSPADMIYKLSISFTKDIFLKRFDLPQDSISNENVVLQQPEFPGGEAAMMKYLSEKIKYPSDAQRKGIEGLTVISFVVDKEGLVRNISTLKSLDLSIDAEGRRVVRSMPRWKPGIANGKPANVRYTLPIRFSIGTNTENTDKSSRRRNQ
jgi:TonB family protein